MAKENKKKKLDKKARKAAKKAARKAQKKAEKAAKAAKRAAKKARKKAKKGAGGKKTSPKAAQKKAATKASAKATAKPHRLPPGKRHVVEEDEARERVGDVDDKAFVDSKTKDDEAAEMGEEFVRSATSGEEAESEMEEEETDEEQGGPFLETSGATEFGYGTDASNPSDAEPAGRPTVSPPVKPKLS